jgi:pyruvate,water dikinase
MAGFPDDVARMVFAVLWYTEKILGEPALDRGAPSSAGGSSDVLGEGVSSGVYEGRVRVVLDEDHLDRIEAGDVLVCPITSPVWSMVFPLLGALVCDAGGVLSHPASIPAVVGTGRGTSTLRDGQLVRVDGDRGVVAVVEEVPSRV